MSQWLEIFFRENLSIITKLSNILKNEKSPYLQQHKDNPVDWFPWNKETLKKEASRYLEIFRDHPYIFNLGHGILPETNPEMVENLIKIVKDFK